MKKFRKYYTEYIIDKARGWDCSCLVWFPSLNRYAVLNYDISAPMIKKLKGEILLK